MNYGFRQRVSKYIFWNKMKNTNVFLNIQRKKYHFNIL